MNVDPTGKDIWLINEKGEVVEWIEAKEYDLFEFIDDDGNVRDKNKRKYINSNRIGSFESYFFCSNN